MRLFQRKRDDGAPGEPTPVPGHSDEQQEPLLARRISRESYGSTSLPTRTPEMSRSKRRRTRIRSSVYADLPTSYPRALVSYTLVVVLASLVALVLFTVLKVVAWPHKLNPSPIREFLLAAGAWTVAWAVRIPILYVSTLCDTYVNRFTVLLSTFLQVLSEETLRLAILIVLQLHLERPESQNHPAVSTFDDGNGSDADWAPFPNVWDPAFTQVWWIALGWATIDVLVGIIQGYEQLSLYRDVLTRSRAHHQSSSSPVRHPGKRSKSSRALTEEALPTSSSAPDLSHQPSATLTVPATEEVEPIVRPTNGSPPVVYSVTPGMMHSTEQLVTLNGGETVIIASPRDLEAELSHLITRKQRAELEEVYGLPLPRIPIFLIALQRLDSILLSIGLTLLISSAYLRAWYLPAIIASSGQSRLGYQKDWEVDWGQVRHVTIPVFGVVVLIHFILSTLWIEALPRIGVHTASYVGLLVSLGAFFAGLGVWGALV